MSSTTAGLSIIVISIIMFIMHIWWLHIEPHLYSTLGYIRLVDVILFLFLFFIGLALANYREKKEFANHDPDVVE